MIDTTEQTRQQDTMSDEEFFAARREAMGDQYPGDAEMRRRDAEDDADMDKWMHDQANTPAPAAQQGNTVPDHPQQPGQDWDARTFVQETFKDDPNFSQLSEADRGKLEELATEKHNELAQHAEEWADGRKEEWGQDLHDNVVEGLNANPQTANFAETRLADGDFSEDDKHALEAAVKDMTPAEQMGLVRPIVEEAHQMKQDVYDGAEMLIDEAVDDVKTIVDTRAEMPGGDSPEIQKMQQDLDEAPAKIHDAIDFMRHDDDAQYVKVQENMDAVQNGADPHSLHDHDTWQVDYHASEHATAEA